MALTKSIPVYGFTTDAYAKIASIKSYDHTTDKNGKVYKMDVQVRFYINNTKEYCYKEETYHIDGLSIGQLTHTQAYTSLKSGDFTTWSDC